VRACVLKCWIWKADAACSQAKSQTTMVPNQLQAAAARVSDSCVEAWCQHGLVQGLPSLRLRPSQQQQSWCRKPFDPLKRLLRTLLSRLRQCHGDCRHVHVSAMFAADTRPPGSEKRLLQGHCATRSKLQQHKQQHYCSSTGLRVQQPCSRYWR